MTEYDDDDGGLWDAGGDEEMAEGARISEIYLRLFAPMSIRTKSCVFCLFVCFVALRPKSTAMVIAGRSVHLSTLFPGQA